MSNAEASNVPLIGSSVRQVDGVSVSVMTSADRTDRIELGTGSYIIGRGDNTGLGAPADEGPTPLTIADPYVSVRHSLLEIETGAIRVSDLGSANGTSVNGHRLDGQPVVVRTNDAIELGNNRARIEFERIPGTAGTAAVPVPALAAGAVADKPRAHQQSDNDAREERTFNLFGIVLWLVLLFVGEA